MPAPEHFFKWHLNLASVGQRLEQSIGFGKRIRLKVDVHRVTLREGEAHLFWRVCAHEHMSAEDGKLDMHDQISVSFGERRLARLELGLQ